MFRPLAGHGRSQSSAAAGFARMAWHRRQTPRRPWSFAVRWASALTDAKTTLALPSEARYNAIGVQQVSNHIYDQIFPGGSNPPSEELVKLAEDHLRRHDLLGKNTGITDPIAFDLPPLQGDSLDEHFYRLGVDAAEPFLSLAKQFSRANAPPLPRRWERQSGWTKYYQDGRTEAVACPEEAMLVFDTEVLWKESPFAVMACAASPTAWYAWLSPWLLGESDNDCQLIPLGDPAADRIVVGHNIGYDRARVLEEYDLRQSRNAFLDTMSLHVAVNGMCSQQRPTWMKHKKNRELRDRVAQDTDNFELSQLLQNSALTAEEEELWVGRSSVNSLRDVAKFHLDVAIDKSVRDEFGVLDRTGVLDKLDSLLYYCAADVAVTHRVFQIVFPNFLDVCPHPVSFAALRHLSSVILPVNKSWETYIANAEATYLQLSDAVQGRLISLANEALEILDDQDKWSQDPWMQQLDWSVQPVRMVKGKRKGEADRPALNQKMPGKPTWYKGLFPSANAEINLTVRTRIAPILLRLSWDGRPLVWSDKHGWTFRVPVSEAVHYDQKQMARCDMEDEKIELLKNDVHHVYFKLPHKDGPTARCVNPMAKSYLSYFEQGLLSSEFAYAKEALEMNASCSYWMSARDRIKSQLVVYNGQLSEASEESKADDDESAVRDQGFILPQVIPMGTVTRRAVENTWLTASNAKKNRVGSELKAMVKAPPGYSFVGADVDSEELWIASVVGDATFGLHGGNAIGFMTLEGTKAAGTDLHSRTASILGITRNDAKVFNYGRIYGAGLRFAAQLLRQFNPSLSEAETVSIATKLYLATKGTRTNRKALCKRPFWRGGTESFVFNRLEEFAEQERPRTPVLGAGITEALMGRFISKGGYLTSRINWAIQSSGQDYLHLLIVAMDYLIRRFKIDARLAITVHDEIRYLVGNHDKYRTAMALQVANVWTRAMFSEQVGIRDLPQSCAFFSAVDIDHVLRKEVDMDCVTPSHKEKIPHGESIDLPTLLAHGDKARLDPDIEPAAGRAPKLHHFPYTPRKPVMESLRELDGGADHLAFIRAQITADDKELKEIMTSTRKPVSTASPSAAKTSPTTRRPRKPILPYHTSAHLIPMGESVAVTESFARSRSGRRASGHSYSQVVDSSADFDQFWAAAGDSGHSGRFGGKPGSGTSSRL
ncbi:DNA polymerase gamma [Grosmannia clavigera kw1407]|uniref:DNA-directed DNA polymerase n=1 Tax=Grosmannia clavigera (strain kw1407 / UAMH 11150) TaxID=655863 RepID=F0XS92_GROCL|nr:DNA polymerase gamma [Grosmannia clavigera kw1407]EFW99542.1 DNA polymerase gamma [Grosmannia clavigera kw1407]